MLVRCLCWGDRCWSGVYVGMTDVGQVSVLG